MLSEQNPENEEINYKMRKWNAVGSEMFLFYKFSLLNLFQYIYVLKGVTFVLI